MSKHLLLSAMGLLLSAFAQAQTTVTFKPGPAIGKDALIHTNTGSCAWWNTSTDSAQVIILAETWTFNSTNCGVGISRGLFKFTELSTVPSNAIVTGATLTLYGVSSSPNGHGNAGSNSCVLARVTSPWAENTATWNTQPSYTTANQLVIPGTSNPWNYNFTSNSADLAAMVQYMVSNPTQNEGFIMMLQSENIYNSLAFASADHPNSSLWPELTVTYTIPADTCNTHFEYAFTTLSPNQATLTPLHAYAISDYTWTVNNITYTGQGVTHTFPGNGSYNICLNQQLDNGDKCEATCAPICIGTGLGINNALYEQGFEVNVSPNPSSSNWTVGVTAPKMTDVRMMIMDISGRELLSQSASLKPGQNELHIEASSMAPAIYFLKIVSANGKVITHSKLIKE